MEEIGKSKQVKKEKILILASRGTDDGVVFARMKRKYG